MSISGDDKKKISALLERYDVASREWDLDALRRCHSFQFYAEDLSSQISVRGPDGQFGAPNTDAVAKNASSSFVEDLEVLHPTLRSRANSRISSINDASRPINGEAANLKVVVVVRTVTLGGCGSATETLRIGRRTYPRILDRVFTSLRGRTTDWRILSSEFSCERVLSQSLGEWTFEVEGWETVRGLTWLGNRPVELFAPGTLDGLTSEAEVAMDQIINHVEDECDQLGRGLAWLINQSANKSMWLGEHQPPFQNVWPQIGDEISITVEDVEQPVDGLCFHLSASIFDDYRVNAVVENWKVISHIP